MIFNQSKISEQWKEALMMSFDEKKPKVKVLNPIEAIPRKELMYYDWTDLVNYKKPSYYLKSDKANWHPDEGYWKSLDK